MVFSGVGTGDQDDIRLFYVSDDDWISGRSADRIVGGVPRAISQGRNRLVFKRLESAIGLYKVLIPPDPPAF